MRRYFVDSHYMELTSKLSLGRKNKDELVLPEAALPWTLSEGRKKLFPSLAYCVFLSNDISSLLEW